MTFVLRRRQPPEPLAARAARFDATSQARRATLPNAPNTSLSLADIMSHPLSLIRLATLAVLSLIHI